MNNPSCFVLSLTKRGHKLVFGPFHCSIQYITGSVFHSLFLGFQRKHLGYGWLFSEAGRSLPRFKIEERLSSV